MVAMRLMGADGTFGKALERALLDAGYTIVQDAGAAEALLVILPRSAMPSGLYNYALKLAQQERLQLIWLVTDPNLARRLEGGKVVVHDGSLRATRARIQSVLPLPERAASASARILVGSASLIAMVCVAAFVLLRIEQATSEAAPLPTLMVLAQRTLVATATTLPTTEVFASPPTQTPQPAANNSSTVTDIVNAQAPTTFSYAPTSGVAPLTVMFTIAEPQPNVLYQWDFDGDDVPDVEGEHAVEHTFVAADEYIISLTGLDASGTIERSTSVLIVEGDAQSDVPLLPNFTVDVTEGHAPLTVAIENESSGAAIDYAWDFDGDNAVDSVDEQPGTWTYAEAGQYEIVLIATDQLGNQETVRRTITVFEPEVVDALFFVDKTFGQAPLTLRYFNRTAGAITSYEWDFDGDGIVDSTVATPESFTYQRPGVYTATLRVTDQQGLVDTWSEQIEVEAATSQRLQIADRTNLLANFIPRPASGAAPLAVTFADYSVGDIASYEWDFDGDGAVDSRAAHPDEMIYTDPGIYDVRLVVRSADGRSDTKTLSVRVSDEGEITNTLFADFDAFPYSGTAPLSVTFEDLSQGEIVSYAWDFDGDGAIDSTITTPDAFTFSIEGTYLAQLLVTDAEGNSAETSLPITVHPSRVAAAHDLYANFFVQPNTGFAPHTIAMRNFADGQIVSYAWDFDGDGVIDSTAAIPEPYTYTVPGEYDVTLTVTAADGGQASESQHVTVLAPTPIATATPSPTVAPPVQAAFTVDLALGEAPLAVTFTDASTGAITQYAWDFNGDGIIDQTSGISSIYVYQEPGAYTARLTVSDGQSTATHSLLIMVVAPPTDTPFPSIDEPPAAGVATDEIEAAPLEAIETDTEDAASIEEASVSGADEPVASITEETLVGDDEPVAFITEETLVGDDDTIVEATEETPAPIVTDEPLTTPNAVITVTTPAPDSGVADDTSETEETANVTVTTPAPAVDVNTDVEAGADTVDEAVAQPGSNSPAHDVDTDVDEPVEQTAPVTATTPAPATNAESDTPDAAEDTMDIQSLETAPDVNRDAALPESEIEHAVASNEDTSTVVMNSSEPSVLSAAEEDAGELNVNDSMPETTAEPEPVD